MSTEVEDFLAHYGVPGMRWGKRKATSQETRANNKAAAAKDHVDSLKRSGASTRKEIRGAKAASREATIKAKITKDSADAQNRIDRAGNSKAKANLKVAGRTVAIGMLTNVIGNTAYSALKGSPTAAATIGIGMAAVHAANLTYGVKDVLNVSAQPSRKNK